MGQRLATGEPVPECQLARDVTGAGVDLDRLAAGVEPEDAHLTLGGADQVERGPDQRGLARAIRADEAEHLAAPDLEVDSVKRLETAVALDQPPNLDHASR